MAAKKTKSQKKAKPSPAKKATANKKTITKKQAPAAKKKVVKPVAQKVVAKKKSNAKPAAKKVVVPKKVNTKPVKKVVVKSVKKISVPVKEKLIKVKAEKPAKPLKEKKVKVPKPEKIKKVKEPKPQKEKPLTRHQKEFRAATYAKINTPVLLDFKPKGESVSVNPKLLKFELEYSIHCSPRLIYEFISSVSGLAEWFADDVNLRDNIFTFKWDNVEQKAMLLHARPEKSIRFRWVEEPDSYFEFKIQVDELTNDVALILTDFAEDQVSKEAAILLWNSQIERLLHLLGSY